MNKDNIYFSLKYAILGDIIGFGHGDVEFNFFKNNKIKNDKDYQNFLDNNFTEVHIYNFINDGGFSKKKLDNLIVSDDSVLLLAVYDGIKHTYKKSIDEIVERIKDKLVEYYLNDEQKDKRYYGFRTTKSLERLSDKSIKWDNFAHSDNAGGCGASMRSMSIGYYLYGEENRDKLMQVSIQSSRITHNNGTGYLGGFMSALFTALAIEGKEPIEWFDILLSYFESNKIFNFIRLKIEDKFPNDVIKHKNDIDEFQYYLNYYKKLRLVNFKDNKQSFNRLNVRNIIFHTYFGRETTYNPGSNGLDSVLIAYDSILVSGNNFEKLIYNAMLHAGDSDSTGCIAGALFGAYYGDVNLPKNYDNFDYDKVLNNLFNQN